MSGLSRLQRAALVIAYPQQAVIATHRASAEGPAELVRNHSTLSNPDGLQSSIAGSDAATVQASTAGGDSLVRHVTSSDVATQQSSTSGTLQSSTTPLLRRGEADTLHRDASALLNEAARPALDSEAPHREARAIALLRKLGINKQSATGVALAAGSAAAFGVGTPLIARVGQDIGPFTSVALLQVGAVGTGVASRFVINDPGRRIDLRAAPYLAASASLTYGAAPGLLALAVKHASPTEVSLLLNLEAVFTGALAFFIYKERLGVRAAAAAAALVGGGVLASLDSFTGASASATGCGIGIGVAAVFSVNNIISKHLATYNVANVTSLRSSISAAVTGVIAAGLREPLPRVANAFEMMAIGMIGYGLASILYLPAQNRIGATRTGAVFALGPLIGAGLAWAMGGKPLGIYGDVSVALFVVGLYLQATEKKPTAAPPQAAPPDPEMESV